jgi:hypothetical protein
MSHTVYFDSPEYKQMQRERRIHVMPRVPGASAVHVVFAEQAHIVERGKLSASMAEARRLVHQLMEQHDAKTGEQFDAGVPASSIFHPHATLRPIPAHELRAMRTSGVRVLDPVQLRADYDLIVQTCFEAIRDCGEPEVRMQAAHILHEVGFIPRSAS